MFRQDFKVDPKALRKIAIDKFGCNIIAPLDDEEVRDKVMKDHILIQEVGTEHVYLIARSQLTGCIELNSDKKR